MIGLIESIVLHVKRLENLTEVIGVVRMDNSDRDARPYRAGSPTFYGLLETMAKVHENKSHDYASDSNPYGNYHFAGELSQLFHNPHDAGFLGRIAEKLYRLANLENSDKIAKNETIEDTELDVCVILALWMASRRDSRKNLRSQSIQTSGQCDVSKGQDPFMQPMDSLGLNDIDNALGRMKWMSDTEIQELQERTVKQIIQKAEGLLTASQCAKLAMHLGGNIYNRKRAEELHKESIENRKSANPSQEKQQGGR